MAESTPDRLARNTTVMAAGTVLSRLTGFGRDFALAYTIGFGFLSDGYNLANTTPNILYELVLGGVLAASLLPVFVQVLAPGGDDDGWRSISAVLTVAGTAVVAISVLVALGAPLVVHLYTFGNSGAAVDDQRAVATFLLRLFAPQIALLGFFTMAAALLNARRRFAAPMFTPVLNNLVVIAVILSLPRIAGRLDVEGIAGDRTALLWLGLGTTAGYVVQGGALAVALRRAGARLRWVWDLRDAALRTVLRLSGWTVGFVIANQVALFAVYALATDRGGDLSAYQAAFRFFQLPHAVLAVSIMSALQPELADRWHAGDGPEFRERLWRGVRLIVVLLVPAAVGYALLSRPLIGVVLEHGRLSEASAAVTADTLALFALGLPGFSVFLLFTRAYQAMQDTRTVFFLYLVENGINVVLAVILHRRFGVQGLAVSYALAYAVAAVLAARHLGARVGGFDARHLGSTLVRTLVAAAAMAVVVVAIAFGVPGDGRLAEGARVLAAVAAGAATYFAVARALGISELAAVLQLGARRRNGGAARGTE